MQLPLPYPFVYPSTTLLVGKSKKGKSSLTKNIVLSKCLDGTFQFGIVFCKSKFNHGYNYVPDHAVIDGLDYDVLNSYINKLKEYKEKTNKTIPNFIIFDDLQGVLNENADLNSLFSMARHYGSSLFICVQYMNRACSTTMRENVDYLLAFNSKTGNTIDSLHTSFGKTFSRKVEPFAQHFQAQTKKPYHAMLFIEDEDHLENNYLSIVGLPPERMNGIKLKFSDENEENDQDK